VIPEQVHENMYLANTCWEEPQFLTCEKAARV